MQRRSFLKNTGLAGILAAGSAPAFAQAPTVKWRCASSFPKSLDTIYGAAEVVAKTVRRGHRRQVRVQVFASGEIVPGLQVADAVQNGTVRMRPHGAVTTMSARIRPSPSELRSRSASTPASSTRGGTSTAATALQRFPTRNTTFTSILCGNTGAQMGGWYRKEIKSVDDLKGLKCASAASRARCWRSSVS